MKKRGDRDDDQIGKILLVAEKIVTEKEDGDRHRLPHDVHIVEEKIHKDVKQGRLSVIL